MGKKHASQYANFGWLLKDDSHIQFVMIENQNLRLLLAEYPVV